LGSEANKTNDLTGAVIGAAIAVHRALGPGLLESVYEQCLSIELQERGIRLERQKQVPLSYRGRRLNEKLRLDLLVEDEVVCELKSVEELLPIHEAQILSYMKLSDSNIVLLNFNVPVMKDGIKRMRL
jgi:GxxExxY protein